MRQRNPRGEGSKLANDIVAGAAAIVERTGTDEAVTLRSVAREVGIAAPSIYAHFADRDAILWGLVGRVFDDLRVQVGAVLDGYDDPVDRLVAGCEGYVAYGLDNPALYRVLFARQFPEEDAPAEGLPVGGEAFGLLVEAIERCVAAGRSVSTDPFADATAVWVALHGMVSLWSTVCDFPWPEDRHRFVTRLVLPLAQVPVSSTGGRG